MVRNAASPGETVATMPPRYRTVLPPAPVSARPSSSSRGGSVLLLILMALGGLVAPSLAAQDRWKAWLDEVEPIMTRSERAVFGSLKTDQERTDFQSSFWKVRDSTPGTPENEFRTEFYRRRDYAERRLGGARSDRGRVYMILGKPSELQTFAGLERVVDCELWIYRGEGRSGLPPHMDLIFYRPDPVSEYKLYSPGAQTPVDLLSPGMTGRPASPQKAYRMIKASYPELATAALAVTPEEADAAFPTALNSSGRTIGMIFTLPEREVARSYLRRFNAPPGTVEVGYSAKEIAGTAEVFETVDRGIRFLHYSLMPDRISTARTANGLETAHLVFRLRVEDASGTTIFQQEKEIHLRLDAPKAEAMRRQKLAFNDLAPLIEGDYRVRLTFTNKTSEEFFVAERAIAVSPGASPLVLGYHLKEAGPDAIHPFGQGGLKALVDPRAIFSRRDSLEGLIFSDDWPEIILVARDEDGRTIAIPDVAKAADAYRFTRPLADVAPGTYDLVVNVRGAETARHRLHVLSFEFEKPLIFERTEPVSFWRSLPFVVGQEYLDAGRPDKALGQFDRLPPDLRNAATVPVVARAHYLQKDYARVLDLLEASSIAKTYPVLLLLGNSALELKKLRSAAGYFEELRKFGDTAEVNNTLGAVYLALGEKEKSDLYWERARKLERESRESPGAARDRRPRTSSRAGTDANPGHGSGLDIDSP